MLNSETTIPADQPDPQLLGEPSAGPAPRGLPQESSHRKSGSASAGAPLSHLLEEDEAEGFDFRQILGVLLRRWKIMIVTFLVVMAVGMISLRLTRPIYQANASLQVDAPANPGGSNPGTGDLALLSDVILTTQTRSLATQVEIIRSTLIYQRALDHLSSDDRTAIAEGSAVDAAPVGTTDVLLVSSTSFSPRAAVAMVNAVGDAYVDESKKRNRGQVSAARTYLENQLQVVGDRLNRARTAVMRYKQRNHIVDVASQAQQAVSRLHDIESALAQASAERAAGIAQLQGLQTAAARTTPEIMKSTVVRRPIVDALQSRLTQLELSLLEAQQEYAPGSPQIQTIEGQITALRQRLSHEAQTEVGTRETQANPARLALVQDIAKTQTQIGAADARSRALQAQAAQARLAVGQLPQHEFLMGQLTQGMSALEQTYKVLNDKYQTLRISEEALLTNARLISPAQAALQIEPRWKRTLLMTLLVALIVAVSLAVLMDLLDDRVHSDEDAEQVTRLPVLTHVPFMKESQEHILFGRTAKTSPILESYRMLRTNLAFSMVDEPVRSVVVTSSQSNEGKSVTSVNLAVVMALGGKRVILMDGDLRRPSLHRLLQLPNTVGFTNVVAGQHTLADALHETGIPGLQVLTSGPQPPNPPELLDSRAGRSCLRHIMEQADFIVVDSPPALALADAQILAAAADAVLLVVSARDARKGEIARTRELLAQTGTRLLGIILNKVTAGSGFSGYYGYQYSYYKHYGPYLQPEEANGAPADAATKEKEKV